MRRFSNSNRNIFKDYINSQKSNIPKLPSLTISRDKKYGKIQEKLNISLSNTLKIKQSTKFKDGSKITSITDYNKKNRTIEAKKSIKSLINDKKNRVKLEKDKEKLKNLVKCFKELDEKDSSSIKILNSSKDLKGNIYNKELTNTFTKFYRISRHQQKLDVIKLNTWDEDNLESFYGNTNIIYKYLHNHYTKKNNRKKLDELEYFKRIIDHNGNFEANLLKSNANANNKILQNFIDKKNMEQGSILHNIISKTHNRFKNDLIVKDKKIALNFGIDNDAFKAMKKEKDMGAVYYGKIIKEKEKQETAKREELMNLSIKILNKKKEKEMKEKNIGKHYEETNNIIKQYNGKIALIKEEIEEKMEYFNKIKSIEVRPEDEMNKKNQLNQIQLEREKLELQLLRIKYDLKSEIKKLDEKKLKLIEDLEICKNELLFMKIAHVYLTKEQRNYYLDLLNKGYDIRNEGLVWIVKRLLEIQTKLEYHHFPKYLDNDQADYIIELANLNLEETQLKIVIDVLQKKQNNLHDKFNKEMVEKLLMLSQQRESQAKDNINSKYKIVNENKFSQEDKLHHILNDIYKKYEGAFKINSIKHFDEMREKKITEELKLSLMEGGRGGGNFDELTGLTEFLNNNKDNKDYFEFILKLKLRMRLLAKKKETLRQQQILLFRETLDNDNRYNYAESSLKYDLVWGALFGNRYNI